MRYQMQRYLQSDRYSLNASGRRRQLSRADLIRFIVYYHVSILNERSHFANYSSLRFILRTFPRFVCIVFKFTLIRFCV